MTTLTIGRTSGLTPDTNGLQMAGRSLTVSGYIKMTTTSATAAARQQMLTLMQPGEEVVPIIWSSDASFDGFYRVTSVDVNHYDPRWLAHRFTVTADRVDGFAAAQFESVVSEVVITNSSSLPGTGNIGTVAIPAASLEGSSWTNLSTGASMTSGFTLSPARSTETGSVILSATTASTPFTAAYRWSCPIGDYYDGAAMIEVQGADSTWRPFCGNDAIPIATSWRISNSLVRLTIPAGTGVMAQEAWNGSSWDTAKNFQVTRDSIPTLYDRVNSVRVIRNRPEAVTVRVGIYISSLSAYASRDYIDVSVRRGMMWFDILASGPDVNWGIRRTTNEASTSITGGIRATAADAAGNFYWMASPVATTKDTTVGQILRTSTGTTHHMGLGVSINGSTAAVTAEIDRWSVACPERHEVVSR